MAKLKKKRYLSKYIEKDLREKMVFIGGARQIGKTTLALTFLKDGSPRHPAYLNWDNVKIHAMILKGNLPPFQKRIIFDEIHKYSRWRNLIKGFYDTLSPELSFIITGSARLDYYRRGGDSLQGRYHYYRLHPFSLNELNKQPTAADTSHLLQFGGFPEPCLKGEAAFWRRWQLEYAARIIYEDIRSLEHIREISLLELLVEELPARIGSPLSVKNLKELLQVAHETVERWITILERMYFCFRLSPFGGPGIRAVRKEQKLYFLDWSRLREKGPRFENLLACQLLKYCHFLEDTQGLKMELRFLRDTDLREIDFVVVQEQKPLFAVECKTGEKQLSRAIPYFKARTAIPCFYQVHLGEADYLHAGTNTRVLPFHVFCRELNLP